VTPPRALLAALLALALAGCPEEAEDEIEIYAFTAAPVGLTAAVRNQYDPPLHDVQITSGVTIAVGCWDSCDYTCVAPTLVSADPGVLRVQPLYRATSSATQFVLIAVAPGSTHVTVRTDCAEASYAVEVLAQ
jgi:hypothetical protein